MPVKQMARVALPALHVHGAAEHHRVVVADVLHVTSGPAVDLEAGTAQLVGDRLRDLGCRAVLAGEGDQDRGGQSVVSLAVMTPGSHRGGHAGIRRIAQINGRTTTPGARQPLAVRRWSALVRGLLPGSSGVGRRDADEAERRDPAGMRSAPAATGRFSPPSPGVGSPGWRRSWPTRQACSWSTRTQVGELAAHFQILSRM